VARAYIAPGGWLQGSDIDPSQTRLPMAVVAVVYTLLGKSDLITARLVSILVGALTIIAVYLYAKRLAGHYAGLLAAGTLAVSPFFLAFARVAFTETDIYLACTLAWLLVSLRWYQDKPSSKRSVVTGILLGLCMSAKFTALTAVPVIWFLLLYQRIRQKKETLSTIGQLIQITFLAAVTFFLIPPEHFTNPIILKSLFERFTREMGFNPGFIYEAAVLHFLCLLLKPSIVLGAGLVTGWFASLRQWQHSDISAPILLVGAYMLGLLALPLAQTFYTVPLLPMLSILAAYQFTRLFQKKRIIALSIAGLAVLAWGVDMALCYPDYNLNGYQWLGDRVIAGRSSIGYRSVVQTPSDGVEQVVQWLNEHAEASERAVLYILPWHIFTETAPHPIYRVQNGFERPADLSSQYILIEINASIYQSWWIRPASGKVWRPPVDPTWLSTHYEKVFSVKRAFGIEMASVWQKKD
jgi:hypothetical protein